MSEPQITITQSTTAATKVASGHAGQRKPINPAIILLSIVLLAVAFTYVVNSGTFQRQNALVVPGSYQVMEKSHSLTQLFSVEPRQANDSVARPVSLVEGFMAIPQGIEKRAALIFMVLFIGGMFGVLNKAGVIDAGLERLLGMTRGNIYVLVPMLMLVFSAGSTFMGLAKEFILIVPLMVAMANRLGLSNLIGLAIVCISVKIGYLASITNPVALSVAQPMVGLPIFSGMSMRIAAYALFLSVGIAFVLWSIHKQGFDASAKISFEHKPLPMRHLLNLLVLGSGIAFMVFASTRWSWKYHELSAFYLALSIAFAAIAGMGPSATASAFVDGMKKVLIAGVLIGLATAVEIILTAGQVLDTIVNGLASVVSDHGPVVSAYAMFFSQLGLDVLIPSTSGQAAVTMPIFGPLGQLSGVSPQTTVYAFLLGNGLTNMITPTSSGLLVLLATAQVGWGQWARYILPLFLIYMALAMVLLAIAVTTGY